MSPNVITDGSLFLSKQQAEELWELGNAGTKNAANALSCLLNTNVSIKLPEIIMVNLSNMQQYLDDSLAAMVVFQIRGQVQGGGTIVLHVPKDSILRLGEIMLGKPGSDREIDEMDMSMLHEIGNILTSAFLDACASLLSIILIPSPPAMVIDMPHAVLETIIATQEIEDAMDEVFLFRTDMNCAEHKIDAELILLPTKNLMHEFLDRFQKVKMSAGLP